MTTKDKQKLSSWDRRVTVNFSIPLKVLSAIDERVTQGKRSEYVTEVLLKELDMLD
jgi:hypothetical protein